MTNNNLQAAAKKVIASLWVEDIDLEHRHKEHTKPKRGWGLLLLTFSALGVVYGDIGTSPLFVYQSIFPDGAPDDENNILGVFSMIFWTITSVVLIKYVLIMLRADDNGEGGIISLYSLIKRAAGVPNHDQMMMMTTGNEGGDYDLIHEHHTSGRVSRHLKKGLATYRWQQVTLLIAVLLGVNMIISDGILTPAISVVAAVEGIQFNTGISKDAVVGISISILVVLFCIQPFGTHKVSFLFSPIILLWFLANSAIALYNIILYRPSVLKGLSPSYIYYYWSGDSVQAWRNLGGVMLSITGAEALYADLGNFSALSISISFLVVVYPATVITYLGQTAFILEHKPLASSAYWASIPSPVYAPMVVLATVSAIIASQSLITGAFAITKQAIAIKCFPRFTVMHTSASNRGEVYIPEINWSLMIGCIAIVAGFQDSVKISSAYGLAIAAGMLLDTILLAMVMIIHWEWHPAIVGVYTLIYSFISGAYLSSNLEKVPRGAWFSIVLSVILSIVSFVYWWGQTEKAAYVRRHAVALTDIFEKNLGKYEYEDGAPSIRRQFNNGFKITEKERGEEENERVVEYSSASSIHLHPGIQSLRLVGTKYPVARIPGLGIYYSELLDGVSPVLVNYLSLAPAIYEAAVFVTIRHVLIPTVRDDERLLVRKLSIDGFYHVCARYGYMEMIDQGPEFIRHVVEELLEYLSPEGGINETVPPQNEGEEEEEHVDDDDRDARAVIHNGNLHLKASIDPGVSLNSTAGRKLLSQMSNRLRGEKRNVQSHEAAFLDALEAGKETGDVLPNGNGTEWNNVLSTGQDKNKAVFSKHLMLSIHRGFGCPMTGTGADIASSSALAGENKIFPVSIESRPWVRSPSALVRMRSQLREPFPPYNNNNNNGIDNGDNGRAKLPRSLSLPQPRPCIYRVLPDADADHVDTISDTDNNRNNDSKIFISSEDDEFADERAQLLAAYEHGVVYFLGRSQVQASLTEHERSSSGRKKRWQLMAAGFGNFFKKLAINGVYDFLDRNSRSASADYKLPMDATMEMKMMYDI